MQFRTPGIPYRAWEVWFPYIPKFLGEGLMV